MRRPLQNTLVLLLLAAAPLLAQPGATLEGQIFDATGGVPANVRGRLIGFELSVSGDGEGPLSVLGSRHSEQIQRSVNVLF
jgi:hypothetical protein